MSGTDLTTQEARPRVEIDLSIYAPLFEDDTISDDDKMALLNALWSMILSFAQIGWGVHPVQQAQSARGRHEIGCGKAAGHTDECTGESRDMLSSSFPMLTGHFDGVAASGTRDMRES
ncbi:hypothetical protein J3E64_001150 [Sphingobium sp. OAS761]|uniref:hypothetical protein n=1 Tax=Sphingobium sp. OAS761 TaxID=2817901 RepID=UPI0020A0A7BD|nr:hypothetical protein [Sphingobium sp. OAS761]MCP1469475.1 hypothetical protein [Sphingobium sp. OAS761]